MTSNEVGTISTPVVQMGKIKSRPGPAGTEASLEGGGGVDTAGRWQWETPGRGGGRGQWSERARSAWGRHGDAADGGVGENREAVQGQDGGDPAFGGEEETLEVLPAGALRKQDQFLSGRSSSEGPGGQPPGGT